jgi:hypothetical protein
MIWGRHTLHLRKAAQPPDSQIYEVNYINNNNLHNQSINRFKSVSKWFKLTELKMNQKSFLFYYPLLLGFVGC